MSLAFLRQCIKLDTLILHGEHQKNEKHAKNHQKPLDSIQNHLQNIQPKTP
jgi:hypothetical protein